MKYNQLSIKSAKSPKRVGRGISAGGGKTAGRGTKGQGARKSSGGRPGFEGGQMPTYMRLPHLRGFKSHRVITETVKLRDLSKVKAATVDNQALYDAGLVTSPYTPAKLVGKDEVKKTVKLQSASLPARKALEAAGGSFEKVDRVGRAKQKPADKSDKA